MYICPLCQHPLQFYPSQYRCINHHSFDIAREGYVNLLPVQQKKSKDPGDNKLMMQARRQFLQAGWYQPLADAVSQMLRPLTLDTLLDLGCGEGYYSQQIMQALPECQLYGLDISKSAIKYAAKANSKQHFCVASAYQLPFANNSFDGIVRIYAPSTDKELRRVIRTGGYLLTVTPGPKHLIEIKQAVYTQVRLHSDEIAQPESFTHLKRLPLQFSLQFSQPESVMDLIQMVPLAWKFTAEQKQLFANNVPQITTDFQLDLYQKI